MSTQHSPTPAPLRVPVGSLVAVAPPGAGKTTILRSQLAAAGLRPERVVCRDDLRARFGGRCEDLAHRVAPKTCQHFEEQVSELVTATSNNFLIAGQSWLYDQTGCVEEYLVAEVERAHARGLAAVALRRRSNDGSADVSLDFCAANNAARARRVPDAELARMHAAYAALTPARLRELGFDVVLEWDEHTRFELMPEGVDARHIDAELAIIGDIHGCAETFLERLLPALGTDAALSNPDVLLVSVGDIHDKGQHSVEMIRWWLWAVRTGRALMVHSNHNKALLNALAHPEANVRYGLAETLAQIEAQPDAAELKEQILATFSRLPSHLVFADHVVVHAAMTEDRLFRTDARTTGFAVHTRYHRTPWEWTGSQTLVHGHVVVDQPARRRAAPDPARPGHVPGEVVAVDTGAYAGGGLSAYLTGAGTTITVPTAEGDRIDPHLQAMLQAELIAAGVIPAPEASPAARP